MVCLQSFILSSDINECNDEDSCVNGQCVNQPGSYRCVCPTGTHMSTTEDNTCIGQYYQQA